MLARRSQNVSLRVGSPGITLVLSGLLVACGARTGLDEQPGAAVDAARPDATTRRDGGFFATFPCRWTLGLPVDLTDPSASFDELSGSVHPIRGQVILLATRRPAGGRVGAILSLTGDPAFLRVIDDDPLPSGPVFATELGWTLQHGAACALSPFARPLESESWGESTPASTCRLNQSEAGQILSVSVDGLGTGEVFELEGLDEALRPTLRATSEEGLDDASAFYDRGEATTLVLRRRGTRAVVERHRGGRVERYPLPGEVTEASAAVDRLRGGMLVLYRVRNWFLDWVPIDADPPQRLIGLGELPAEPAGPLASNETEALIPLRNGQMAYVALALSELRLLEPVEGGAVEQMRVVLRHGESGGGLLFTQAVGREQRLRFQPLACNR